MCVSTNSSKMNVPSSADPSLNSSSSKDTFLKRTVSLNDYDSLTESSESSIEDSRENLNKPVHYHHTPGCSSSSKGPGNISNKQRVCFHEADPEIIDIVQPSSLMSSEERSQRYWQSHDHRHFRQTAHFIASEIQNLAALQPKKCSSYEVVLTKTYQKCASLHEEGEECNDIDHSNFSLPEDLFCALAHWAKAGHSRRGLEKFSVLYLSHTRPVVRQTNIQAVLFTQKFLKDKKNGCLEDSDKLVDEMPDIPDDEILRLISQRYSRANRKYAYCMGHADAAAVGTL